MRDFSNLIPVILGNFFGIIVLFTLPYYYCSKKKLKSLPNIVVYLLCFFFIHTKRHQTFLSFEELKTETKLLNINNYNDKSFHQAVPSIGPAPFDLIEKYLPAYYTYIE